MLSKFSKEIFWKLWKPYFQAVLRHWGKVRKNIYPVCKNFEIVRKNIQPVCKSISASK